MRTEWWQSGVIYQIYPRSFQDSNGDGIGDLDGITSRLSYFEELGIDAIWISPIFPSPMKDFGYDVSNYDDIDPIFGSMKDFDRLIKEAHARDIKVILDFVPNHSSDQHPWFQESKSSRENPKRDWYIWRDPKSDGSPPNNWISDFGGPAWTFDPTTNQYYSHAFLKEQPDLNWRNSHVRLEMYDSMRKWFNRGVDGFRLDVLWHVIKAQDFRDNPVNPDYKPHMGEMHKVLQLNSTDQPEAIEVAREMRALADRYDGRVLIGEIYLPFEKLVKYYGPKQDGVHMPFNFTLIDAEWKADTIFDLIARYEASLPPGAWPNWVLGNHDRPRIASRVGLAQARVAATLLLTLRGTPTMYYGDELGMEDGVIPLERVVDPREILDPGKGLGRDPVRTPMPWTPDGGFTEGEPWLPQHTDRNVEDEMQFDSSMLNMYKLLLALRRAHPALSLGSIALESAESNVLIYRREHGDEILRVALNFSDRDQTIAIPNADRMIFSTLLSAPETSGETVTLRANEAIIIEAD